MKDKKNKKNKIDELKAQVAENLAGWQRAKADYENLQKETQVKIAELSDYTKASLLTEIIPILDNFNKAVEHVPEDQKDQDWVIGVFHIKKQLEDFLKNNGLEKIETIGKEFDENLHEAVGNEKGEPGKILKEVSSGYKLNCKVIVPAKVIVGE